MRIHIHYDKPKQQSVRTVDCACSSRSRDAMTLEDRFELLPGGLEILDKYTGHKFLISDLLKVLSGKI
jgi:hypothetical protein